MRQTILIADDHVDTVETTKGFLEFYGYDVAVAYDGLEALTVAEERKPFSVLLDIALPRLDGFKVARALRQSQTFSDTIIVGYSGYVGQKYYEQARASGIDFYLLKPAAPDVLIACLQPEQHLKILAESVIVTAGRDWRALSADLLAHGQALSARSAAAVRRAQDICQKNANRWTPL